MKKISRKISRKTLRKNRSKIFAVVLVIISLAIGVKVFAASKTGGYSGGAGSGGNTTAKCKTGNCKSVRKNGAYWLLMPASSDNINPASIFGLVEQAGNITGCKSGGGWFYVLVTPLSGGGLAGPVSIDKARTSTKGIRDGAAAGLYKPSGAKYVTPSEAQAAFAKNADFYATKGQRWSGTNLGWFCADPKNTGIIEPEEEEPEQDPPRYEREIRQYGETVSRIAVENMSVDGISSSTRIKWRAGYDGQYLTSRRSLYTDSGPELTTYDAEVTTYAKPGDSVRFLHEFYLGNRAVRAATSSDNQDKWTDYKDWGYFDNGVYKGAYNYKINPNKIPDQNLHISGMLNYGDDSSYTFSSGYNNIGLVNAYANNASSASSASYYNPFVSISSYSIVATGNHLGVGVISPATNNGRYNCNTYSASNSFITGGFQIPGFIESSGDILTGSCRSADLTTENNLVGKTFGQRHTVDQVRAWEKYYHSTSGSCGCNSQTYSYTKYDYTYSYPHYNNGGTSYYYADSPTLDKTESTLYSSTGNNGKDAKLVGNYSHNSYYAGYANGNRKEFQCKSEPTGTCNPKVVETYYYGDKYSCTKVYDETNPEKVKSCTEYLSSGAHYGTSKTENQSNSYSYTDDSFTFKYLTEVQKDGQIEKKAVVRVPYNFETSVESNISGSILFQGSNIESSFTWSIDPRNNTFLSSFPYATITPENTKVQLIEFLFQPGSKDASGKSNNGYQDPCAFFGNRGAVGCQVIEEINGAQNPQGLYGGWSHYRSANRVVPDNEEYVGFKYCVAIGINYTSSHRSSSNSESDQNAAMSPSTNWNISSASCRPIAKKPNFQVWNGSIYTPGEVNTSISKKAVGLARGNYNEVSKSIFGSWTDYAIIAGGDVYGMASGARLGYNNGSYKLDPVDHPTTSMKEISPETISNNSNSSIGRSGIDASVSISSTLNRLKTRYRDKADSFANEEGRVNQKAINTSKTGMQYVSYSTSKVYLSSISVNRFGRDYPNQTTTMTSQGLVKGLGDGKNDNTLVIHIDGTLVIDRNICLATNGNNCAKDSTMLSTYGDIRTDASAKLPQILIFADNIEITSDVTRIDAWLISDDGTLNTCNEFTINSTDGTRAFRHGGGNYDNMQTANGGAAKCYKTLVVNGPIFTSKIKLYRTAGNFHAIGSTGNSNDVLYRSVGSTGNNSDTSKGSGSPAEIFNMRADAYIWAYNQAQRYSEAVVTYTRELAPRY